MTASDVKDATEILEETMDVVEDTLDLMEAKVSWITSNPKAVLAIASLTSAAVGGALVYAIVSKRLSSKWQRFADEQIAEVKAHYALLRKDGVDLSEMAATVREELAAEQITAEKIMGDEGYTSYTRVETPVTAEELIEKSTTVIHDEADGTMRVEQVVETNVFEESSAETYFDMDSELRRRAEFPDAPYIITKDEFDNGEMDFEQAILTYYEGDGILVDSTSTIIDDENGVVGAANLLRFGAASGDRKVVYIRNERLEADYEVVQSTGEYAKEVLGFDGELSHSSHDRRARRFGRSDE